MAEAKLISFLRKLPNIVNEKDLIKAKRKLLDDWSSMKSDRFQRDFFTYFPYTDWITSKIRNKPFREVYMQGAHERTC